MSNYYLDAIEALSGKAGIAEIHHRSSFKCYREPKGGGVQEVLVEVFDRGPKHSSTRYSVVATSVDDGRTATGNPDSSLEGAIAMVHWWTLDTPRVEAKQPGDGMDGMNEEAMSKALDAINHEAETLLKLDLDPEVEAGIERIIALSRYKFPVTGEEPGPIN